MSKRIQSAPFEIGFTPLPPHQVPAYRYALRLIAWLEDGKRGPKPPYPSGAPLAPALGGGRVDLEDNSDLVAARSRKRKPNGVPAVVR